jgi:hypothetical protein
LRGAPAGPVPNRPSMASRWSWGQTAPVVGRCSPLGALPAARRPSAPSSPRPLPSEVAADAVAECVSPPSRALYESASVVRFWSPVRWCPDRESRGAAVPPALGVGPEPRWTGPGTHASMASLAPTASARRRTPSPVPAPSAMEFGSPTSPTSRNPASPTRSSPAPRSSTPRRSGLLARRGLEPPQDLPHL